ncbi:TGN-related, localized SYP41 interacting protein isoform X3 [Tasmannia lanceolata]|uniref:TGN-related, localized SYP41 interacting protein isoform X3 n=1 Tax=Tasmannia lanceolata TaxID=3420 RepID=UPI004062A83A
MSDNYTSDHIVESITDSPHMINSNNENGGSDGNEYEVVSVERFNESSVTPDLGFSSGEGVSVPIESSLRQEGVVRDDNSVKPLEIINVVIPDLNEEESPGFVECDSSIDTQRVSDIPVSETESSVDHLPTENGGLGTDIQQSIEVEMPISIEKAGHDNGISVNMDGSIQGDLDDGNLSDDAGKEDMFVDAPDQLAVVGGRNVDLRESLGMIESQESLEKELNSQDIHGFGVQTEVMEDGGQIRQLMDELAVVHVQLEKAVAEKEHMARQCKEYKEERDMFAKELTILHSHLQVLTTQQSLLVGDMNGLVDRLHRTEKEDGENRILAPDMRLDVMVNDCFKFTLHLKSASDEHLSTIRELHAVLFTKDQEIEDLIAKVTQLSISQDVVSCTLSHQRMCSEYLKESYGVRAEADMRHEVLTKRILSSLAEIVQQDDVPDDSITDEISLVEKKTALLIENYKQFLSGINHLGQCLSEVSSDFMMPQEKEFRVVFDVARDKFLEQKRNELDFLKKIEKIEEENQKLLEELDKMKERLGEANAETIKTKVEIEQAEGKLVIAREKLSMAVTKGKALVQQRDSLRQSLNEKTNELEKCLLELQQKSSALEAAEVTSEELNKSQNLAISLQESLLQRNTIIQKMEEIISEINSPDEVQSMELIDSVRWLVDQKNISEGIFLENRKLKDALSSMNLPETVSASELEFQINWLGKSFIQRNADIQEIEEVVSKINAHEEIQSMEVVDKVRWLVDQKNISEGILLESNKLKGALSSIDLPETVLSTELESQIKWLGESFSQAKDDIIKLQDEIIATKDSVASQESSLLEARKEIELLTASLVEDKREKESLQTSLEDLTCKYENLVEKSSQFSSEKDGLMRVLLEISGSAMGDQVVDESSADTHSLIAKCTVKIRERLNRSSASSLVEREHFQTLQSLLYVRDQELMLCEKMLEEDMFDRSDMLSLSNEFRRISNEVEATKSERDLLEKDLERAEEKSSLLREKLSMAVKKGKGLIQEREGFKLSLDEKTKEIEKLKFDLQQRESEVIEFKDQIKNFSGDLERIPKLESDVIAMKVQRDQIEGLLQEGRNMLQRVVDYVECIVLPTNSVFEEPVEKLKWMAVYIQDSQAGKAQIEQELEKTKEEASFLADKLVSANATVTSLEDALSQAEKNISILGDEKNEAQVDKTHAERELEKAKAEAGLLVSKVSDACATIKSLEEELSRATNSISVVTDRNESEELKSKQEIITLNARLDACMEDLAATHGRLGDQASEMVCYFNNIQIRMKDEGLLSLMTEGFKKKLEGLRNMGLLIQNIREQFAEKDSKWMQIPPSTENVPDMGKVLTVPQFEVHPNGANSETGEDLVDSIQSYFTKIVEGLDMQNKLLGSRFEGLSSSMDEHIAVLLQALQATKDEVTHMLELMESLKLNMTNLEAKNKAQENKLSMLQNDISILLSACTDATQDLQIDVHNGIPNPNSNPEQINPNCGMYSRSIEVDGDAMEEKLEKLGAGKYAKSVENLLLAARRVRTQSHQFENAKSMWLATIEDLKNKLQDSKSTTENAIQDRDINLNRVSKLEFDIEALQNCCSEMKLKLEDYQTKEDNMREKEAELASLSSTLAAKDQVGISGADERLLSEIQVNTLLDKVKTIQIPLKESDMESSELQFLGPANQLFYIIDSFVELQHRVASLTHDKDELQLSLADQVHEIGHLKKEAESFSGINKDLERKKNDLAELVSGLEKIIQKLGGNDTLEDKKSVGAKGLLPMLEKLVVALILESESSKSKAQDLDIKLQGSQKVVDELSAKVKLLENSVHEMPPPPDTIQERSIFEASSLATGSEISEIEDMGSLGKKSIPPVPAAAHVRTMRKGSSDHLALNIDLETDRLINHHETDDKGHIFKSLNTSGFVPKQGKLIADRIDGIWVSGGRILMSRPGARMGLIAYWLFLHIWVLGTIL